MLQHPIGIEYYPFSNSKLFRKFDNHLHCMSTVELKNILIHRISEITDVSFLEALKTILDSKSESAVLTLTNEQRSEILASKNEIEQGLLMENVDLEKEMNEWLNTK